MGKRPWRKSTSRKLVTAHVHGVFFSCCSFREFVFLFAGKFILILKKLKMNNNSIPDSFVDKLIAVTGIKIEYKTKKKKLGK
jgi:hypothetical protein